MKLLRRNVHERAVCSFSAFCSTTRASRVVERVSNSDVTNSARYGSAHPAFNFSSCHRTNALHVEISRVYEGGISMYTEMFCAPQWANYFISHSIYCCNHELVNALMPSAIPSGLGFSAQTSGEKPNSVIR